MMRFLFNLAWQNLANHLESKTSLESRGVFGVQYNIHYYIMNVSLSNWEIHISQLVFANVFSNNLINPPR